MLESEFKNLSMTARNPLVVQLQILQTHELLIISKDLVDFIILISYFPQALFLNLYMPSAKFRCLYNERRMLTMRFGTLYLGLCGAMIKIYFQQFRR